MPLHLLGKKSWNVYNRDNIDKVRQDEERARLAEQEIERHRRDNDAADRLRLLRGDDGTTQEFATQEAQGRKRKRDAQAGHDSHSDGMHASRSKPSQQSQGSKHDTPGNSGRMDSLNASDDPLDHISNMRFRDAAGRQPDAQKPWYSSLALGDPARTIGRDVWGNEDVGRQARNEKRLVGSDPLLAIKKGVKQLREAEKQKNEWRQERERDLNEVEELARRGRHRMQKEDRHRHHRDQEKEKDRHRRRHRHRSRNQSRSRSPERHRRPKP